MRELAIAIAVVMLVPSPLAAQRASRRPPAPWPAELGEAFELYYAGQFVAAARVCQQVRGGARDPNLRRQAAALEAMAMMHSPARADRIGGRAQLAQLAEEDPSFLTRPECQLAYGIAQTALHETASALLHLTQAAESFAERGESDRLGETYVALARAWARHGEWELAVPGIDLPKPADRREADRIRAERIRALREKAASLADGENYAGRIDLILAESWLDSDEHSSDAVRLLEELADNAVTSLSTAQACLMLAERYEAQQRWTQAAQLYARVESAGLGEVSRQAERRRRKIERPQLILSTPRQVSAGESVTVSLSVRNLEAVSLEVRRVNLADWLEQRQGRFTEAALPAAGALISVRDLNTEVETQHAWWRSESLSEPLSFTPPIGAVVVVARGTDATRHPAEAKRLVLGSDLQAAVFVGGERAAIWATRCDRYRRSASVADAQARFWMHGSFVPTHVELHDGATVFALPPETRVLRDKRWVCIVQAGEEIAVCEGTLPTRAGFQPPPVVALVGGPSQPLVGEDFHLFGLLQDGSAQHLRPTEATPTVEIELIDTLGNEVVTVPATVSDAGTFYTQVPISRSMVDKHLRVIIRLNGNVLENAFSTLKIRPAAPDPAPFELRPNLPKRLTPSTKCIEGSLEAVYPWGTAVANAPATAHWEAVPLSSSTDRETSRLASFTRHRRLDEHGKVDLAEPMPAFGQLTDPMAIRLTAQAEGWDRRTASGVAELLVAPEPAHLWLSCHTEKPRAGEPLDVSVGWFDPSGLAAGVRPSLEVRRDGIRLAQPELLPTIAGSLGGTWRPAAPGRYELAAALLQGKEKRVTAREVIEVGGADHPGKPSTSSMHATARFVRYAGQLQVCAQLVGHNRDPLLVLVEAGAPLAARQLAALDGTSDLVLPVPEPCPANAKLIVATFDLPGALVRILDVVDVQPAEEDAPRLTISYEPDEAAPGANLRVEVTCRPASACPSDTTLMARLVEVATSGGVPWRWKEGCPAVPMRPGGIEVFSSGTPAPTVEDAGGNRQLITETRRLSTNLARAFFADATLWVDSRPASDDPTVFFPPLPRRPGFFRLIVTAQGPGGAFAHEALDLDLTRGIQPTADVPRQLALGDRTVGTLTIVNNEQAAAHARVTLIGGSGLHIDDLRHADTQLQLERTDEGISCEVAIPPTAATRLHARLEAARPGSGTATFLVETDSDRRPAALPYFIYAEDADTAEGAQAGPEALVVERRIFVLEKAAPPADDAGSAAASADTLSGWQRVELDPNQRVPAGQLLLVRETLVSNQPLAQLEWTQRLPGNCHTHAGQWPELSQVGVIAERRLDTITLRSAWLAAGREHTHEYVIVPVRPGVCRFPAPTINLNGSAVRVELIQETQHVLVENPG